MLPSYWTCQTCSPQVEQLRQEKARVEGDLAAVTIRLEAAEKEGADLAARLTLVEADCGRSK